jgi:predicted nucleotidyltransferase
MVKKNKVKKRHVNHSPNNYPKFNKGENMVDEKEIALDFATRLYKKFDKIIKSVVLFGSSVKNTATPDSDVDIFIIVDDAAITWDQELIAWYREELAKLIAEKPYSKNLHVNTTKLTTWWSDMMKGDPVVINILRYGESLIDFGGFFNPLKVLLSQGRIRSTPEAIFTALERAPAHLSRSKASELGAIEGVYWCIVDSAHAALMAAKVLPPSPEHVPAMLLEHFVDRGMLKSKYVVWYRNIYDFHRRINHGHITEVKGSDLDEWQARAEEFFSVMTSLVKSLIQSEKK